jgi:hypothetical protein
MKLPAMLLDVSNMVVELSVRMVDTDRQRGSVVQRTPGTTVAKTPYLRRII